MKKSIFIAMFFLLITTLAKGQNTDRAFTFNTYIQPIDTENVKDYSSHELGDLIAGKMHVVENTFLVRYETKVGLSRSEIEVQKPDLLESVEKLNKYYRKKVKKGEIGKDEAVKQLSNYLDIAYTLFYEESTGFEKALRKTKKAEDIIMLYDRVQLIDSKITANK